MIPPMPGPLPARPTTHLMNLWRAWLDSLDSDGGHLIILLGLIIFAWWTASMEIQAAALGALLMKVKDAGSNIGRERSGMNHG